MIFEEIWELDKSLLEMLKFCIKFKQKCDKVSHKWFFFYIILIFSHVFGTLTCVNAPKYYRFLIQSLAAHQRRGRRFY